MIYTTEELSGILQGYYGGAHIRFRLYESSIYGERGPLLEGVEDIEITMSNYNDWMWELSCTVTDNHSFNFDASYVKAEVWVSRTYTENDEDWHRFPMGLYRFQSPSGTHELATQWELTGTSVETLALGDSEPRGFYVPANSDIIAQCRLILITMRPSIPASRINFPKESSPVLLPKATYFDPLNDAEGTRKLRIINRLLNAGGYHSLYTDTTGRFTTKKIEDEKEEVSDVYYSTEKGQFFERKGYTLPAQVMVKTDGISDEYNDENFANRIVVLSGDTNQKPPIYAIAENNDPGDPLSIPRLGRVVQPEPITLQSAASTSEAFLVAKAALARASGRYRRVTFSTPPDPRRIFHERYRMNVWLPAGNTVVSGKWRVIGWRLSEEGMEHEIARLESGLDAPWLDLSRHSFKGAWDADDTYYRRDIVQYLGSRWMALRANKNVSPTEGLDWTDSPDEVSV